jgi:exonuclease VII small subunit
MATFEDFLNHLLSPPSWKRTIVVTAIAISSAIAVFNWYYKGVIDSLREQVSLSKAQVDAEKAKIPNDKAPPQPTAEIPLPISIKNENIQVNHAQDTRTQSHALESANMRLENEITRLNREVASITQLREELAMAKARIKVRGQLLEEAKKWVREDTKREIEAELK